MQDNGRGRHQNETLRFSSCPASVVSIVVGSCLVHMADKEALVPKASFFISKAWVFSLGATEGSSMCPASEHFFVLIFWTRSRSTFS